MTVGQDSMARPKPKPEPKPVNIIVTKRDGKVAVKFDQALNLLQMEPVAAIRIGEMLKEKGIELLREDV